MKITIVDYINSMRVYNSLRQMQETDNRLLNIGYKNGFNSMEYFSETFKKIVGVNPMIVKNYFKHKKGISEKNLNLINHSMVKLYDLNERKERYLLNQKPEHTMAKKLTIFKS